MKNMLGNTGLEVPPLIFGGNVFGWTADEVTSFALLDEMVEAGFNAIDTADAYTHWAPGNRAVNPKPSSATGCAGAGAVTGWSSSPRSACCPTRTAGRCRAAHHQGGG